MSVTADTPAAFRRRGSIPDAYGWDDLASVIALTGDANHIHIPGSPYEWKHPYVPISEAAAKSHGGGKVPKGWKAPSGGGGAKAAPAKSAAAAKATGYRLTRQLPDGTVKTHPTIFKRPRDAAQAAFYVLHDNGAGGRKEDGNFASRLQDAPLGAALKHSSGYSFTITPHTGGSDTGIGKAGAPAPAKAPGKPATPERPNTIVQPDPVTGNLREMSQKETAEAAGKYAQTLRPGSAERGEIERQAMDIARGGPTWQRMKADADAMRPLIGKTGAPGSPKPEKDLSFFEVQNAYQAAHGRQAPKSMLRQWAFGGPSAADKRSAWYQDGVARKSQMRTQMSLRSNLISAQPEEAKAADANARADIKAVQQSGQHAAAAARAAATAKPKVPRAPRAPAPKKSAADKLGLISERMGGGDKTSGDMQAGDMLQGHQAIGPAPVGIIGGTSDPWWMAGPGGSFALSVKGKSGQRQLIPWGAEKQKEAEVGAVKATQQYNRYGASHGNAYQQALAATVAARVASGGRAAGLARSWDDLDLVIDLAVRTPVVTPAVKAPARPPGKPPVASPVPPAAPSRRRGITPLTPMRVQAAKSMSKLADSMRETHPDMLSHQHVRDAARMLRAGNEEAAQRHLRAAMFSLTPQSLMRHGLHTDDAHMAARQAMHGAHRHLLLVKDIADVAAKNQASIAKASYGDNLSAPPHPDPNNGYGSGALAQKPTARQPPGDQALNAPSRSSSGGSDPNVADPVGPQRPGSKQFTTWNDVSRVIELVGPKGYIHGWIFVGIPAPGDKVSIPGHGHGKVTGGNKTHARVSLASGHVAEIKHDGNGSKPGKLTRSASAEPVQKKNEKDWQFANRKQAVAAIAKGHETLFHGTTHEFKPGDIIDAQHANRGVTMLHEGKQYAFASTDPSEATFAGKASRPGAHVYRVEPVSGNEFDPHQGTATSRRTTGGYRVVEEVHQETGEKFGKPFSYGSLSRAQKAAYLKDGTVPKGMEQPSYKKLAYSWDDLASVVVDLSAETAMLERTPAPIGKPGGPGLYRVKGLGHADYFQQVRNGLMKRGIPEGTAHAMTWGILRRWAMGGGKVHPEVRAAAAKAVAEEEAKAKAH